MPDFDSHNPRRIGVILAGGRSERMGRPKWSVPVAGRRMIDYAIDSLSVCDQTFLSAPANGVEAVDLAGDLGLPIICDSRPFQGPLAGLLDASQAIANGLDGGAQPPDLLVVLCCDVPFFISADVSKLLDRLMCNDDAVIARAAGRVNFAVAVYRLASLVAQYDLMAGRLDQLADVLRCRYIDFAEQHLENVNTPDDVVRVSQLLDVSH